MQTAAGGGGRGCTHDNACHRPLTLHSNDAGMERCTGFPPAKLRFFLQEYMVPAVIILVAALALVRQNLSIIDVGSLGGFRS